VFSPIEKILAGTVKTPTRGVNLKINHMEKNIFLALVFLFCLGACKKAKQPTINTIHLNVPFETNTEADNYLYDTIVNGGNKTYNKIKFNLTKVMDNRAFGSDCSSSTGGYALITSKIDLNGVIYLDSLDMPGCTHNDEWDTTNSNIPKFYFDKYTLYLLRLNPYDRPMSNQLDYSVKYVFRKN
jgi:hypothetical protein